MMGKILLDENKEFQFDFSQTSYVWQMDELTSNLILSDVDFITETDKEILFIEYKNANIKGAVNPDGMFSKIKHQDFYMKIARKYYDSLLLFWTRKGSISEWSIAYVLLIEHPMIDKKLRKQLKLKIGNQLPLKLNDDHILKKYLSRFEVFNLEEWQENFPEINITPVAMNENQ